MFKQCFVVLMIVKFVFFSLCFIYLYNLFHVAVRAAFYLCIFITFSDRRSPFSQVLWDLLLYVYVSMYVLYESKNELKLKLKLNFAALASIRNFDVLLHNFLRVSANSAYVSSSPRCV